MSSTQLSIIAGVGPGTGASVARRFASKYTTILLARNIDNLESIERSITDKGGRAKSISADVSSPESISRAFDKIKQEFPDATCAAAVFNATGPFVKKGILDITVEEFDAGYGVSMRGALLFAQNTLPLLLKHNDLKSEDHHPPTLIFTGASASLRGNAKFSIFGAPKFGLRGLAQSIAREFAPQGVHVAHAVIDGPIDIPQHQFFLKDKPKSESIDPEAIAETYWSLHCQSQRCFTHEVDIRAMGEKW
ncbi:putative short-chain dehydrogenase/reductase SDR, NAD(P)-binding domain superfamily [Septoria linicola]|nr:putative short-chain dehydrogenase/reductase SDR, NAD(P)-binding domain superfamily [Septoria linicola]